MLVSCSWASQNLAGVNEDGVSFLVVWSGCAFSAALYAGSSFSDEGGRREDGVPAPGERQADGVPVPGERQADGVPAPGERQADGSLLQEKDKRMEFFKEQLEKMALEKDERFQDLKEQLEKTALDAAPVLANQCAVLATRVVVDSGLRSAYNPRESLTARYEKLLVEAVFEGKQLGEAAHQILRQIPPAYQVKVQDVERELHSFVHIVSKPLHYLTGDMASGLYIGGEQVTMVSATVLVGLLQRRQNVLGEVMVVNWNGKVVYSFIGSAEALPILCVNLQLSQARSIAAVAHVAGRAWVHAKVHNWS